MMECEHHDPLTNGMAAKEKSRQLTILTINPTLNINSHIEDMLLIPERLIRNSWYGYLRTIINI